MFGLLARRFGRRDCCLWRAASYSCPHSDSHPCPHAQGIKAEVKKLNIQFGYGWHAWGTVYVDGLAARGFLLDFEPWQPQGLCSLRVHSLPW